MGHSKRGSATVLPIEQTSKAQKMLLGGGGSLGIPAGWDLKPQRKHPNALHFCVKLVPTAPSRGWLRPNGECRPRGKLPARKGVRTGIQGHIRIRYEGRWVGPKVKVKESGHPYLNNGVANDRPLAQHEPWAEIFTLPPNRPQTLFLCKNLAKLFLNQIPERKH